MADQASSPIQVEDGFSRIAHPILEAMATAGFTASQYAVLLVLIRETFGWGRSDAAVSLTDFEKRTGVHRNTVQRAVASLVAEGVVLVRREASFGSPAVYRLQKDSRKWGKHAVVSESLSKAIHRQEGEAPPEVIPLGGGVTPEGNPTEGNRGVTPEGNTYTGQPVEPEEVAAPERKVKETTTTTTAREPADERTAARAEMQGDVEYAGSRITDQVKRSAFLASLASLIDGDDYTAWRDHTGSQVAWSDRPRLLRLAINKYFAGEFRDVRLALTAVVIPQQYDPIEPRRSTNRSSRTPTDLPCTVGDLKALLRHAGPSIHMAAYRPTAFAALATDHPELWARAGPYFRELDFGAIRQIEDKQRGFGLDRNIDEQLSRIAGRLDAA